MAEEEPQAEGTWRTVLPAKWSGSQLKPTILLDRVRGRRRSISERYAQQRELQVLVAPSIQAARRAMGQLKDGNAAIALVLSPRKHKKLSPASRFWRHQKPLSYHYNFGVGYCIRGCAPVSLLSLSHNKRLGRLVESPTGEGFFVNEWVFNCMYNLQQSLLPRLEQQLHQLLIDPYKVDVSIGSQESLLAVLKQLQAGQPYVAACCNGSIKVLSLPHEPEQPPVGAGAGQCSHHGGSPHASTLSCTSLHLRSAFGDEGVNSWWDLTAMTLDCKTGAATQQVGAAMSVGLGAKYGEVVAAACGGLCCMSREPPEDKSVKSIDKSSQGISIKRVLKRHRSKATVAVALTDGSSSLAVDEEELPVQGSPPRSAAGEVCGGQGGSEALEAVDDHHRGSCSRPVVSEPALGKAGQQQQGRREGASHSSGAKLEEWLDCNLRFSSELGTTKALELLREEVQLQRGVDGNSGEEKGTLEAVVEGLLDACQTPSTVGQVKERELESLVGLMRGLCLCEGEENALQRVRKEALLRVDDSFLGKEMKKNEEAKG